MAILSVKCIYGYPVWTAALTAGVSLALTYLLWFTGSWGGGDAKACLGALLLVSPAFPVLLFIIAFSSGLALIVAVRWMYRLTDSKNRHRHDSGGRQLGPSLLAAFILSAGACSVLSGGS
ncbi:hypothetical protein RCIX944 [Methanocella arvoryzae MRE50]|uniref:Prepilin type IV endopeptidase peptidase domain-containing protein n=2 Tax=Methanocella TaxID=570266 RepID=Q0W5Q5_METAR|nr:hypothetical protein RCIX944 [Methanocella arvoryzae MRE50]